MENSINDAIKRGFLQQVRFLIEYGHSVNERDELWRTPLINCALIEDETWGAGMARLFIEKGAKISLRDKRGLNALHYACVYGRKLLVDVYLNALDFDLTLADRFGNTALHYAASTGSYEICKSLVNAHQRYKLPTELCNQRRETPLLLAWKHGHVECGNLLIEHCEANVNAQDIEGQSAEDWLEHYKKRREQNEADMRAKESRNRPRTASARLERLSQPRQLPKRPATARFVKNFNNSHRKNQALNSDPVQLIKSTQQGLYRPASQKDLRNKPEYVFQESPADRFVNQARYSMSDLPRPRSASHMKAIMQETGGANWRQAVSSFFTSFDYQFSHSFCRGAVPPLEPDPDVNPEDRGVSPTPTHASEYADSESVSSKKGLTRKAAHALTAINKMNAAVEKGEKRKTSRQEKQQPPSAHGLARKVSSLAAPSPAFDSSSTESVGAGKKAFMKALGKK